MTTLTKEMVMRKAKVYNIETITQLHLFNQMINNIDIIKGMKSLESITLSRNQIKSLKAFEGLKNLSVLSLQDNLISDFTELMHLRNCINLRKLWLGQNPISSNPAYRLIVIRYLPFLNFLDEKEISDEEREGAHNLDEYAIKNNNHFNHNHFNYNYVKNKNPYKKDFVREKKKKFMIIIFILEEMFIIIEIFILEKVKMNMLKIVIKKDIILLKGKILVF